MTLSKYLAPILQLLIVVGGALQIALADNHLSSLEAWQFTALCLGVAGTFAAKLLDVKWAGVLKIGAAALGAGVAVILEFLNNGGITWNTSTVLLIGIGILTALAAQVGVSARLSAVAAGVADPAIDTPAVAASDPGAYAVVTSARHVGT
jgi:hypothetical protein